MSLAGRATTLVSCITRHPFIELEDSFPLFTSNESIARVKKSDTEAIHVEEVIDASQGGTMEAMVKEFEITEITHRDHPGLTTPFRHPISLPWLLVACYATVDLGSAAYVIETENFERLLQRCDFQIATASGEENGDLSPLYDLLDWVYYSVDTTGMTALPKLLNAGLLDVALKGAKSSSAEVSSLCREILNAISFNVPLAARMGRSADVRDELLEEVKRHVGPVLNWLRREERCEEEPTDEMDHETTNEMDHEATEDGAGDPVLADLDTNEAADAGEGAKSVWGWFAGRKRLSRRESYRGDGDPRRPEEGRDFVVIDAEGVDGDVDVSSTREAQEDLISDSVVHDDVDGMSQEHDDVDGMSQEHDPKVEQKESVESLAAHMHQASNALRALRNVVRACHSHRAALDHTARSTGIPQLMLWPLRVLYGESTSAGRESKAGVTADRRVDVVDVAMVHSIMLLLDSLAASSPRTGGRWSAGEVEDDEEAVYASSRRYSGLESPEVQALVRELEVEAVSAVHDISNDARMVELLMRRGYLGVLVRLASDHSSKAAGVAGVATFNICAAFARRRGGLNFSLGARRGHPTLPSGTNALLEGTVPPSELTEGDRQHVEEAVLMITYLFHGHPYLSESDDTVASATTSAAAGFAWGGLRRLIAWRQAGEHFAVGGSGMGLGVPGEGSRIWAGGRAAIAGGLRAGLGAAILTALYGVFGVRFFLRDETLDNSRGRKGTMVMSCARTAMDLGVLHVVLRLCPYSLVPMLAVNASLGGLAFEIDSGT